MTGRWFAEWTAVFPARFSLPLLLLLVLLGGIPARGDEYEDRLKPGHCRCHEGQGTWEYLRSPLARPEEAPRCGLLLHGGNCAHRPRPKGVSGACWSRGKVDCFWRRHAYSWNIRCSECWKADACDACADLVGGPDEATRDLLEERIRSESQSMRPKIVVAVSPHFYVVTNLHRKVKVRTYRGTYRLMTAHEVAHLYAQRCEQAYDDFEHWFGGRIVLPKPMAVYLVERVPDQQRISKRYFGDPETEMNYAFNYTNRIAEGFSGNGFVVCADERRDDNGMHGFVRHMVGHILFSCWIVTNGFEDQCPRWAWIGAAHFMEKLLEVHDEYACFCAGETQGSEGPRKRWPKRVRDMAKREMPPIETFFGRNSLSDFSYKAHLRTWSIMDLMLREDRDRWLALLGELRNGGQEGAAFKKILGITPDAFHERWKDRVLGRRKTMAEIRSDAGDPDEPGRRERARILEEVEPEILAGRIRGLDVVQDAKLAKAVVSRLSTDSDLIRETIHLVLLRSTEPEVLEFLREKGLRNPKPLVRAGVARVLGALRDTASRPRLEELLGDRHWLVKADAAYALQQLGDPASRAVLAKHLDTKDEKAWMAVTDAFASFPGRTKRETQDIARRISGKRWQVRLTAVRALRRVGTDDCLEPLVLQFASEDGRLKKELHATLKVIARDDLGPNPDTWRRWWDHQKKTYGGLPQDLPEMPANPADERYGDPNDVPEDQPHYYGRRFFSRSICYVLDTSGSMKFTMKIKPEQVALLGNIPTSGSRMEIARAALVDSIQRLDPRTRVRMVFFSTQVQVLEPDLAQASAAHVAAIRRKLASVEPDGGTNFYGAIRAALGMHQTSTLDKALPETPDTVFFLTDGRPTRGQIQPMPELTSWMRNVNRFAKVRLHVIALGELNVDIEALRTLAEAGDGETIWVQEP